MAFSYESQNTIRVGLKSYGELQMTNVLRSEGEKTQATRPCENRVRG